MSRYTGPVCRLCRAEGAKLFLKGDRCYTEKCGLTKRNSKPGQHGTRRGKMSEYGIRLREKQKLRRFYGINETQVSTIYKRATGMTGQTGHNFLQLLERRLDNTVFKAGLAENRKDARQLVLHGHFTLNGKKVTVPSLIVKVGDTIAVKESSRSSEKMKELIEGLQSVTAPKWLDVDKTNAVAKVIALPARDDVDFPFEEHLIVELYSK